MIGVRWKQENQLVSAFERVAAPLASGMDSTRRAALTVEGLIPFAVAGVLFGLLYNALFYPRTAVEYLEAGTIGLMLGIASGIAEQSFLRRWLQGSSFIRMLMVRTLLYAALVAVALSVVLSIEPATLGECFYSTCLAEYLRSPLFARDLGFSTLFIAPVAATAQVVHLVGTRNVGRLMLGRYRQPREVQAVFMFVDLQDSTGIAERLGHERFSTLLSQLFTGISGPIHDTKGEVYQYVGDEAVIVWLGEKRSRHGGWLSCYRAMRQLTQEAAPFFVERYGFAPDFKAGAHAGPVIATEVGTLQRALVYHGDVLNTAARIRSLCNEMGYGLLASAPLVAALGKEERNEFDALGPAPLRGRSERMEVFGYQPSARPR